MAPPDVRALLRAERTSRRLTHPLATYAPSGHLSCSLCQVAVKSESVWDSHLHSAQHVTNLQRRPDEQSITKKRKAAVEEDYLGDVKRFRDDDRSPPVPQQEATITSIAVDAGNHAADLISTKPNAENTTSPLETAKSPESHSNAGSSDSALQSAAEVDEDEWAAFERDVNFPEPEAVSTVLSALATTATIEARPMTNSELQSQAQSQIQQSDRDRRQAELDAEREDASRQLEDEFAEMEALESRVRKLREQREALRKFGGSKDATSGISNTTMPRKATESSQGAATDTKSAKSTNGHTDAGDDTDDLGATAVHRAGEEGDEDIDEEEEEDDHDDELDVWHFRRP